MKNTLLAVIAISLLALSACNNGTDKAADHDMSKMKSDSAAPPSATGDKDIKSVSVTFTNVDPKIAASVKEVVSHYLHIKNALANDNADEAASGAKAVSAALAKVDKSFFTPEQKKVYDESEGDLKEHAEHIGKSKIDHQREHFSMMSEDVYSLVKAFGGGQALYHDHCPMANDGKGAMWLSELKEIKNPYMGSKMPTCGTVEEKIQ
ncbi:DUF3347 domain-containing protein [Sediminibacterium soli]|uniref:DUF3347 domain-containing protein n=1 Tax=Sediminibacterium soli TaxID=2698829 RepID=UPI00137AF66B|nr:DUF3347 domain-containing protein [Sediminibacterium soli]NCI46426.1 DUF3347 domain-containing protein [Sediminibacterium soli]